MLCRTCLSAARGKTDQAFRRASKTLRSRHSSVNAGRLIDINKQLEILDEADHHHDHRTNYSDEKEHDEDIGDKLQWSIHGIIVSEA